MVAGLDFLEIPVHLCKCFRCSLDSPDPGVRIKQFSVSVVLNRAVAQSDLIVISLSHAPAAFTFFLQEITRPESTTSDVCWDHISSEINPSDSMWTYWGECVQTTFYAVSGSFSSQWLGSLSNEVLDFSNETVYRACLFHMNQAQCVVR